MTARRVSTGPAPQAPLPAVAAGPAVLALLEVEAAIRRAASANELDVLAANEVMRLCGARQVFVLARQRGRLRARAVSSLATLDPHAPLVQEIEQIAATLSREGRLERVERLTPGKDWAAEAASLAAYPFQQMCWVPLPARRGGIACGLILAREKPWLPCDLVVAERLAGTLGHARRALELERRWMLPPGLLAKALIAVLAGAGLMLLIPVPMATLAPFEIGSADGRVVSAPLDGVIEEVVVEPNATVRRGDVLVRFADITARNKAELAEHEVEVARAKLVQTSQLAFRDVRGRHDLGISKAELELKTAELAFARDLLRKTIITADRDGIAVFTDKKELTGKPVQTGFRLMEIADPSQVELRIDVPVGDAVTLEAGAAVKAFFDTDPFNPRTARLRHADYLARIRPGNVMALRAVADFESEGPLPRLGARGTVQILGEKTALGFYLFRRPISALRQRLGL